MATVYGSLACVLEVRQVQVEPRVRKDRLQWRGGDGGRSMTGVNADLLMKRLWVGKSDDGKSDDGKVDHLTKVAAACADLPAGFLSGLHERRCAAAQQLAGRSGATATSVLLTPMWRVVVGHGEDTAHETSLTMSPTYGFPILPGSALKGVAASWARAVHGDELPAEVVRLFGTPRPGVDADAAQGSVAVLDALPVQPPRVVVDVLTPHVKPYYDQDPPGVPKEPPAEYHNPVPVRFLAVGQTPFRSWLLGPSEDVERFAELLKAGLDDLGIGGKTAAGYGYCKAEVEP